MDPGSGKHSIHTHFPKDPNCDICLKTKTTRASCRRRAGTVVPRAENVGDLITADHKFSVKKVNLVTIIDMPSWYKQDLATHGSIRIHAKQKLLRKHKGACKSSWSRRGSQKSFTLTIPWKLASLVRTFLGTMVRQRHTRSETNGIAERAVRRVKEGTSAVLLQSGLDNEWWADSMEFCCHLRNIQDLLSDWKTPHERRFGTPFNGPVISFGAMVEYHPISAKDISRLHQFGPNVLPGMFLGYVLYARGNLERRHYARRH